VYACVLIRATPGKVTKVLESVRGVQGVARAFAVHGRYDIVAFIEAPDFDSMRKAAGKISAIKGVRSTETAVQG